MLSSWCLPKYHPTTKEPVTTDEFFLIIRKFPQKKKDENHYFFHLFILITKRKWRVIQFLDELHFSSIRDANQIVFAQKNNQRFWAMLLKEMEKKLSLRGLNIIIIFFHYATHLLTWWLFMSRINSPTFKDQIGLNFLSNDSDKFKYLKICWMKFSLSKKLTVKCLQFSKNL